MAKYNNPGTAAMHRLADKLTLEEIHPMVRAVINEYELVDWGKIRMQGVYFVSGDEQLLDEPIACKRNLVDEVLDAYDGYAKGIIVTQFFGMQQRYYRVSLYLNSVVEAA